MALFMVNSYTISAVVAIALSITMPTTSAETMTCSDDRVMMPPPKIKCAEHVVIKGSIHCHGYDEDVFPCVQK